MRLERARPASVCSQLYSEANQSVPKGGLSCVSLPWTESTFILLAVPQQHPSSMLLGILKGTTHVQGPDELRDVSKPGRGCHCGQD